jgi:NADH-quinone oxidoreductase subunit N
MNAPFLWIFLPLCMAGLLLLISGRKAVIIIASIFSFFLTLVAWLVPIDTAISIGGISFKLASSFVILGRHFILESTDRSMLALIFGSATVWFSISSLVKYERSFIPLGLTITAIFVAALSVEPFLYSALLIEMAVLISAPMLSTAGQPPGKGLLRFIIFQTLAMPFILFSGWLLAGIEANPGDLGLVQQASILIGLGFAFLLAVFPFYSWIPMLSGESSPLIVGFILWMFPTLTLFFGLGFLDHYAWLRESSALGTILITVGTLMIVSAGFLSVFQQHLGRLLGYAVIIESGFSILAIGMSGSSGMDSFFMFLVPRTLSLILWTLALSIINEHLPSLMFADIQGQLRKYPVATSCLVIANLSMAGMPLLAGFPPHLAIWMEMVPISLPIVIWGLVGCVGLFIGAVRVLLVISTPSEGNNWESQETSAQRVTLFIGIFVLLFLGLFPQWVMSIWIKLPEVFIHLGH